MVIIALEHRNRPEPRRAFSLVELLVVIAIIALLLALLLPAMEGVRDMAMQSKCTRQAGAAATAAVQYATDHDGQFPKTDGSWLKRHKTGPNRIQGIGLLVTEGYVGQNPASVEASMFCPDAKPTWNWQTPGHAYRALVENPGSNVQVHGTYVAHFCALHDWNSQDHDPDGRHYSTDYFALHRANLYLSGFGPGRQTAAEVAPVLIADHVFNNSVPGSDDRQGHDGEGTGMGMYDGSAQWASFENVYWAGGASYLGQYENNYTEGNFWNWTRREFGVQ
jgi:prepilin-type N-terminal cleavage/methylation domain-containing protein